MNPKIYKNSLILCALRMLDPFLSMIVVVAISRFMGVQTLGQYSFIMTYVAVFGAMSQMGLHVLLVREVAKNKDEVAKLFTSALVLGLGASLVVLVLMSLSKSFFNLTPDISQCISVASIGIFASFLLYTFESFFLAFEQTEFIFIINIVSTSLRVCASIVVIYIGGQLIHIVIVNVIVYYALILLGAILLNKYITRLYWSFDFKNVIYLLRMSPCFLSITIITIISARIDVLLLTRLANFNEVAIYSAATKLFEMCMILPQAYMRASFPQLVRLFPTELDIFGNMIEKLVKNLFHYVFFTTAVLLALSTMLIHFVYGDKFSASSEALKLLSIGLVPWCGARISAYVLTATDLQRYDLLSSVAATCLNIVLNMILIPKLGAIGTAIANTCSLSLFCAMELILVRLYVYKIDIHRTIPQSISLGFLVFIALILAKQSLLVCALELLLATLFFHFVIKKNGGMKITITRQFDLLKTILRS